MTTHFDKMLFLASDLMTNAAMNLEQARFNMIEQQIRTWDVLDTDVLQTLVDVRREEFVPLAYRNLAFFDCEIPLPCSENMLSPKFEGRILQETAIAKHETVLEIGAGSGYLAALMAQRARHVTTVEIEAELCALASKNLSAYGIDNVTVVNADGALGWASQDAAYDVIVLSGSVPVLPEALLKQIKVGGRIFAVVGSAPIMSACLITRMTDEAWDTQTLFETSIKPLRNVAAPSGFQF